MYIYNYIYIYTYTVIILKDEHNTYHILEYHNTPISYCGLPYNTMVVILNLQDFYRIDPQSQAQNDRYQATLDEIEVLEHSIFDKVYWT